MGHGDHWAAIGGDTRKTLDEWLPLLSKKGKYTAGWALRQGTLRGKPAESGSAVFGMQYPDTPLRGMIVLANANNEQGEHEAWEIWSGYPFGYEGVTHRLTVTAIDRWENGKEAIIHAEHADGPVLGFFDPLYFRNCGHYRVGEAYDFVLSGVAYQLSVVSPAPIKITDPEQIRRFNEGRKGLPESVQGDALDPIEIRFDGAAILMPIEKAEPDDFSFQGPVKSVRSFRMEHHEVMACVATVARMDDADLDVTIYATEHALRGPAPKVGDDVGGAFWLQGYLAGTAGPDPTDRAQSDAKPPKSRGLLGKLWP